MRGNDALSSFYPRSLSLISDAGSQYNNILMLLRKAANHPLLLRSHYKDGMLLEMAKKYCKVLLEVFICKLYRREDPSDNCGWCLNYNDDEHDEDYEYDSWVCRSRVFSLYTL